MKNKEEIYEICNELERISKEENVGDYVSSFLKFAQENIKENIKEEIREEEKPKLNFELNLEEVSKRFTMFCSNNHCRSCCLNKNRFNRHGCFFDFLHLPQNEKS